MLNDWEFQFGGSSRVPLQDLKQVEQLEAYNSAVVSFFVDMYLSNASLFRTPPNVRLLQAIHKLLCLKIVSANPGAFRTRPCTVSATHVPPRASAIQKHLAEMFDYAQAFSERNSYHLAAFFLWRIAWIHPFTDGNGRVARAISYIALCQSFGTVFQGNQSFLTFFLENRDRYYHALDRADHVWAQSDRELNHKVDLYDLEAFLEDVLVSQLSS